ncbi:MAG TPA: exodeoxyribonuclease VII large subunit [Dehalococcoidia bacterium]|jgi:exodeoxyribonuclease VII large subunit|nr:exodeoxyribonuclease VII large subunit [Dehalococcoidia bacterium]
MQVLSVSQAMGYLRELLESNIVLGDVWISGEVSGPRTQPSGHTYFTLKDEASQLRGVLFRNTMQRQPRVAQHLAQGSQVIVHGRLTVYEARGELQVVVDFVQPEGVGLRHAQFERLRQQLEEEGLFDESRKRALPAFPRRIGVVTSPAGAVFHDICNVLRRRWPLSEVVLSPTPVQGPDAVYGVVGGIEQLNSEPGIDVIIVARGGGSVEELWTFNEEPVARAVFGSLIPVVSAVGHETDYTICDYVADLRAPTPSAAAELTVPDAYQVGSQVRAAAVFAVATLQQRLGRERGSVETLVARAARSTADVDRHRQRLDDIERRVLRAIASRDRERKDALARCQAQLAALDPQATLDRGYAVVHKAGKVVSSITGVNAGDGLIIKVSDGGFPARVDAPGSRRRRSAAARAPKTNGAKPAQGVQPVLFP